MATRSKIRLSIKQGFVFGSVFLLASSVLVTSPSFAQEEEKKGFFGKLFDGDERKRRKAERKAAKEEARRKKEAQANAEAVDISGACLLYTSPSPRDKRQSRMPSSA